MARPSRESHAIELTFFLWLIPDDATEGVTEHSSSAATINQFACPSYSLYVQLLWYPMYYIPRRDEGSGKPCAVCSDRSLIVY